MRDGSSQSRLRYGAGMLMVRFRLEAMRQAPSGTTSCCECLYSGRRAILDSEGSHFAQEHGSCPAPPIPFSATPSCGEQQVVCSYDGRARELCPHIIGTNKSGEEVVLAWQFAGESSGTLPQWRCLRLANVRDARARDGRWYEGGSHRRRRNASPRSTSTSMFTCASGGRGPVSRLRYYRQANHFAQQRA